MIAGRKIVAFVLLVSFVSIVSMGVQARPYTVLPGDTLSAIALKFSAGSDASLQQTIENIRASNPRVFVDGNPDRLFPGQVLVVPERAQETGEAAAVTTVIAPAPAARKNDEPALSAQQAEIPPLLQRQNRILEKLRLSRPDFEYEEPVQSEIPGLFTVQVVGGPTLYVSADGKHLVAGDMYSIQPGEFVNLQEKAREKDRATLMAAVDKKQQIVFSPKGKTKAFIHIFTDVDCSYCQKLHREIAAINELGIEVRYLAYPRAGVNSESSRKLATAWCSSDPQGTLTKLKSRQRVPTSVCDDNPIADHHRLGELVGVSGTPNMVTVDGQMIGGYVPADKLAELLGVN